MTDSERRFRTLALAAIEEQQLERGRLARMLHDEVAQILSGAGLQLDLLKMDLEEKVRGVGERTAEIQALLDRVVSQIRRLSYQLDPDVVERAGLQPALDLLVGRFRQRFGGTLRLLFDSSARVSPAIGAAMERIAEEAVSNAIRHSQCTQIEIIVKATRRGVVLLVRDDGIGFDFQQELRSSKGLGLPMMAYRASKAGLKLAVDCVEGKGSTVTVTAAQSDCGAEGAKAD